MSLPWCHRPCSSLVTMWMGHWFHSWTGPRWRGRDGPVHTDTVTPHMILALPCPQVLWEAAQGSREVSFQVTLEQMLGA